jgi:hypothetical protein
LTLEILFFLFALNAGRVTRGVGRSNLILEFEHEMEMAIEDSVVPNKGRPLNNFPEFNNLLE